MAKDKYVLIMPIYGIEVSIEGGIFSIGRVNFVRQNVLFNYLDSLKMDTSLDGHIEGVKERFYKIIDNYNVYVVLVSNSETKNWNDDNMNLVKEAVYMLGSTYLLWGNSSNRFREKQLGLWDKNKIIKFATLNNKKDIFHSLSRMEDVIPLDLSDEWLNFHDHFFFFELFKLINYEKKIAISWKNNLRNVIILIGKSQICYDKSQSFLYNMIALEILLTQQGDRYSEVLIARIESFIGWHEDYLKLGFKEKIKHIYLKRCALVHEGDDSGITDEDIIFSDFILSNVLMNICKYQNIFTSKEKVIEFCKRVEALKFLGIKDSDLVPNLFYIRSSTIEVFDKYI